MRVLWGALLVCAGCGAGVRYRPLEIEILALSARAEVVGIEVFPATSGQRCDLVQSAAQAVMTRSAIRVEWTRASGAPRTFDLPEVEEGQLVIVVHASDASGKPIQFSCTDVNYGEIADFESGVLQIMLSARER